ncbi:MAG: carbohydrate ABC transporter permease, partial [Rhodospirillales bacterium]|nr:carbohydrate ABC transporter permease [Rhodospirillales bacterium]
MIAGTRHPVWTTLEVAGAWLLGLLWLLPLLYAAWTAIHPAAYATHFTPDAPLTFANFVAAWHAAPFGRYLLNTFLLCSLILVVQFVVCTTAAFAFARLAFVGRDLLFGLVLLQLMIMPDALLAENYRTLAQLRLVDTITAIALPSLGSAFGIFLLRQTFMTGPQALDDAARLEGCGLLARLWRVYVPLARPTYVAYGLVSVSYHWNNFLWPLVI